MSLVTETEETDKYKITTLQDIEDNLTLISLPNNWLVWYRDNITTFFHPSLIEWNITVNLYHEINCFLSTNAFANSQNISITINSITDTRQIESIYTNYPRSTPLRLITMVINIPYIEPKNTLSRQFLI